MSRCNPLTDLEVAAAQYEARHGHPITHLVLTSDLLAELGGDVVLRWAALHHVRVEDPFGQVLSDAAL